MVHIHHRIGTKVSPQKLYEALATAKGVASWWTRDTTGNSEPGGILDLLFHSSEGKVLGSMKIKVLDLQANKKVHWKFLDGPAEWIGTEVIFDLKQEGDYGILLFSHINWVEEVEFKAHCNMKWATFLLSLKDYVENDKGKPAPDDLKIDNWN